MNNQDGFILIESLVSLAMVSILAVGTLNVLQSVSASFRQPGGDELAERSLKTSLQPEQFGNRSDMRLESIHTLNDDSTWRVYSFRTEDGTRTNVPVYVPSKEN